MVLPLFKYTYLCNYLNLNLQLSFCVQKFLLHHLAGRVNNTQLAGYNIYVIHPIKIQHGVLRLKNIMCGSIFPLFLKFYYTLVSREWIYDVRNCGSNCSNCSTPQLKHKTFAWIHKMQKIKKNYWYKTQPHTLTFTQPNNVICCCICLDCRHPRQMLSVLAKCCDWLFIKEINPIYMSYNSLNT